MISIPTQLVEFMLFGPLEDRRQLQDSPILGDVWVKFGQKPNDRLPLLISPYLDQHAGTVAKKILEALIPELKDPNAKPKDDYKIACLQGLMVASLSFREVIQHVVPKTKWWAQRWSPLETLDTYEQVQEPNEKKKDERGHHELQKYDKHKIVKVIRTIFKSVEEWRKGTTVTSQEVSALDRFVALTGLLLWTCDHVLRPEFLPVRLSPSPEWETLTVEEKINYILAVAEPDEVAELLDELRTKMLCQPTCGEPISKPEVLIWQVSLNRQPMPALTRSIPAVKADAAHTLFKVDCSRIAWAVVDSGIDGNHPALKDRVTKSYDFRNYRRIVNISNSNAYLRAQTLQALKDDSLWNDLQNPPQDDEKAKNDLQRLAQDAADGGPIHWELVEQFVEIKPGTAPKTNHGTHVAGIIGASKDAALEAARDEIRKNAGDKAVKRALDQIRKKAEDSVLAAALAEKDDDDEVAKAAESDPNYKARLDEKRKKAGDDAVRAAETGTDPTAKAGLEVTRKDAGDKAVKAAEDRDQFANFADGMCPDIQLYDFRVLGKEIEDWEFAIIAALQFIRYLNDRHSFITIHGVNLSLSIPHDIRNFACGRTPICNECERLIESGVVVVTAAGNHGYKSYETKEGSYESYAAFSVTDPGNADSVITVGATHRFWPHTYGVSFFSSRGPTGDGRLKPDLVAPGEKIRGPVPGNSTPGGEWADLDGTSMAAPHVSGAAAMLMARYSEFVGQPRRIKRILCDNATDLGRERSFQGHGMLDVLRAFQSV
jgi:Subtilase family